jgi:hypothetical protein
MKRVVAYIGTKKKESGMLDSENFSEYVMNYKVKESLKDA